MEIYRCVVFTGGSGLAALVDGEAAAARLGEGSSATERRDLEGRAPCLAKPAPEAASRRFSGGPAAVHSEAAGERIRGIERGISGWIVFF
jgi:hypothetical protein